MKTHTPWREVGWRTHCRIFARHIHDGTPEPFRSIEAFTSAYNRRVQSVLTRHLAKGLTIIEACRTRWTKDQESRIIAERTPESVGEHITNRALGFGWSLQLVTT
jgi:hypothetical protein